MIADWNVPFSLLSRYGTLVFNTEQAEGMFNLVKERCQVDIGVRANRSDIPQGDGSILHRRWLTGVEIQLAVQLWANDGEVACATTTPTSQDMLDLLILHARAAQNADDNESRLFWTPTGQPVRLLDDLRLAEYPQLSFQQGVPEVRFTVGSGFPYAIDFTQTSTPITDGGGSVLTNAGSAEFWPVFQVQGPATSFEIQNATLGLSLIYDSTLPGASAIGGGDYVEIDTFRNTLYLNGDEDNMKPGLDVQNSDFFPLGPGDNDVSIDGADMNVLWQSAWG